MCDHVLAVCDGLTPFSAAHFPKTARSNPKHTLQRVKDVYMCVEELFGVQQSAPVLRNLINGINIFVVAVSALLQPVLNLSTHEQHCKLFSASKSRQELRANTDSGFSISTLLVHGRMPPPSGRAQLHDWTNYTRAIPSVRTQRRHQLDTGHETQKRKHQTRDPFPGCQPPTTT